MRKVIAASRGRDITNPNHRGGTNSSYRQVLEVNHNLMCNALTTLLKDNYVLEIRDKKTR